MTQKEDIKNAIDAMRKGGVILYPTDTVWGIGCDATNAEAVAKVYKIKQRDDSKALICLADSFDRVQRYVRDVPAVAWDIMELSEKPTTVILDGAVNLAPNLIAEDGSIGLRVTNEPLPTSAASLPRRTTATSTPPCSKLSTTCAGRVARSTNLTRRAALSNSRRTDR